MQGREQITGDYLLLILLGFIFVTGCQKDAQTALRFLTVYFRGYGPQFTAVMITLDVVLALPQAKLTIYDSIEFFKVQSCEI